MGIVAAGRFIVPSKGDTQCCTGGDEVSMKPGTSSTQDAFMRGDTGYYGDMRPLVQLVEHPGEVRLRLRAATLGELASTAGRALAELELGRVPGPALGTWRPLVVQGRDPEAVLVHWLNELIYLAEAERWVAAEFAVDAVSNTELRMRARGIAVDEAPSRVKAATFHGLRIASVTDGVEAEIVLDV